MLQKIKKLFNKDFKLTYTDEMLVQDELWDKESEDLDIMRSLQLDIVKEAKEKGFDGATLTYDGPNEIITDIYYSQEDLEEERDKGNGIQYSSTGNCRQLIDWFESFMNEEKAKDQ